MKEKYKNNIFYLFERDYVIGAEYNTEGIPFYANQFTKKVTLLDPQSNTYKSSIVETYKTTTQLKFEQYQKISRQSVPTMDDFAIIENIDPIPYMEKGNKHRTVQYWEYTITVS